MAQTEQSIADLKRGWLLDPHWDIEDTEGFEDHRDELKAFHKAKAYQWGVTWQDTLQSKAAFLGVPGNTQLATYVLTLEYRIEKLEDVVNILLKR